MTTIKGNPDNKMTVIAGKPVEVRLEQPAAKSGLEEVTITSFATKNKIASIGDEAPVDTISPSCRPAECNTKRGDATCQPQNTCAQGDYTCSALCYK